jgi:argininosuccinate lyase
MAEFDVIGSLAHIHMLHKIGLLQKNELDQLSQGLKDILKLIHNGQFTIDKGVEDVHSQVELMLGEIGKKIHSGRSRNDQVLLDLKLFFRKKIEEITFETENLFNTLLHLSDQYQNILMPGYTHNQVAMVSSFGLWFGAYAETLTDDLTILQCCYKIINKNPLGSGAGYGSSFPLDRDFVTEFLGFDDLNVNVIHAQMGRGKAETILAFAMASIASTLGKMAMDITLYCNQNHGFISFPDELTTGSSIMPHKKNPDVFELIRGKCNLIQGLPSRIQLLTANLPTGYHRDFQLLKEEIFPAIQTLKECLKIATFSLKQIKIREDILSNEQYKYLFSVEEVNKLVLQGTPFRDAYQIIASQISKGSFSPDFQIAHTHIGSLGNPGNDRIRQKMKTVLESFNFEKVHKALSPFQPPLP